MSERGLRTVNIAAGALLIGGIVALAFPRHALSVLQVVIVSIAAGAGVFALAAHVPPTGWISPFKWMSPFHAAGAGPPTGRATDEDAWIRARLSGRRQPLEGGGALPPDTLRLLKPLVEAALEVDGGQKARIASARGRVSRVTWAVLNAEPLKRPRWLQTEGADPDAVAELVDRVLDDVERLGVGGPAPREIEDASGRRAL